MRKKTICAMMTGFLAVQGIEVHAETQQTTGEAASAVESVELDAEIIENSDVTDADGKAGPEELLRMKMFIFSILNQEMVIILKL